MLLWSLLSPLVSLALLAGAPREGSTLVLRPPVAAPIVDHFRAPSCVYCAGNRGLEYAPTGGMTVTAAAPGTVVFAGPVARVLYVVVDHGGGYRTTYGRLSAVGIDVGQGVGVGTPVGTAGPGLFFGLRLGDTYLDPEPFFGASGSRPRRAHLVPK